MYAKRVCHYFLRSFINLDGDYSSYVDELAVDEKLKARARRFSVVVARQIQASPLRRSIGSTAFPLAFVRDVQSSWYVSTKNICTSITTYDTTCGEQISLLGISCCAIFVRAKQLSLAAKNTRLETVCLINLKTLSEIYHARASS